MRSTPLLIAYPAVVGWAKRLLSRRIYKYEDRVNTILEELSRSIRAVKDQRALAANVTGVVRDSLDLASCALMAREDDAGRYRIIWFVSHPGHPAHGHRGVVDSGMFAYSWGGYYCFDTPNGNYSSYWQVGKVMERGGCRLEYLQLGILRVHPSKELVRGSFWGEDVEAISIPLEVG